MENVAKCPHCGAELPEDAPKGLCPKCLMANALEETETRGASYEPTLADDPDATRPSQVSVGDLQSDIPAALEPAGKYSILGEHGKGGMGRVLLVHDEHLGRDVALKELLPDLGDGSTPTPARHSKEMAARFLREAKITGQLEHPSITPVHEIGRKADGTLYYTMKLVRGRTLSQAIKSAENFEERLKLLPHFVDLCNAIAYAHSRGVIHRDIKPSNVMIGDYGETVIIDWGLAKRIEAPASRIGNGRGGRDAAVVSGSESGAAIETRDGYAVGTPAYMPPEQATGSGARVDERSDVYSLGAVLFQLVAGAPPVDGRDPQEVVQRVIDGDLRTVTVLEPACPPSLAAIVERAMALEPVDRFSAAKELGEAVKAWRPPVVPSRGKRLAKIVVSAAVAAIVLGIFGLDRYYIQQVQQAHDAIRARGGLLNPAEYQGPRTAGGRTDGRHEPSMSVPGFLVSLDMLYPNLEATLQVPPELNRLAETPATIDGAQRETIEAALSRSGDLLERMADVVGRPPAPSVEIVRAYQLDEHGSLTMRGPNFLVLQDLSNLFKLRAALRWQDGDYDGAFADLETMLRLGLHLKDGPGMVGLAVGSNIARRSVAGLDDWIAGGVALPARARDFVSLLEYPSRGRAAANALDAERSHVYQMYRALDRGDLGPLQNVVRATDTGWQHRLLSSLPFRWVRRREELGYLNTMAAAVQAHAVPFHQGKEALDDFLQSDDYLAPWFAPAFAFNLYRTCIEEAKSQTQLDVARVALAAALLRQSRGTFPETLDALTPAPFAQVPIDVFDGKPLRYQKRADGVLVYSVGEDGEDNGGAIDEGSSRDIGWFLPTGG